MKILGIESSGLTAGVCVIEDGLIKAAYNITNKLNHSVTLLPMLRDMFKTSGIESKDLDAVAVSSGPGSFTGLRIGVATAKGLAFALNIPVIRVGTLDAMGIPPSLISDAIICPLMDARNNQVYCSAYYKGVKVMAEDACSVLTFLYKVKGMEWTFKKWPHNMIQLYFTGDGTDRYKEDILSFFEDEDLREDSEKIGSGSSDSSDVTFKTMFLSAPFNRKQAEWVAFTGEKYYKSWLFKNGINAESVKENGADGLDIFDEKVMNSDQLVPYYIRLSQAEQKLKSSKAHGA